MLRMGSGFFSVDYLKAYKNWLLGRRILAEICNDIDVSYPKLNKVFDKFNAPDFLQDKAFHFFNYANYAVIFKSLFKNIILISRLYFYF